jgi:hypothetical protein
MNEMTNEDRVESWLDKECPVPIRYEVYRNYLKRRIVMIMNDRDEYKDKYLVAKKEIEELKSLYGIKV